MKTQAKTLACILLLAPLANATPDGTGVLPPVRSTHYSDAGHYTLPHSPAFNSSVAMTAEAWVFREDDSRVETILSHGRDSSFWFGFLAKKIYFYRSGGDSALSTGEVLPKRWTHVAVSYNGTEARFYIDGQLDSVKALANSGIGADSSLKIGADHNSPILGFRGHLDEVRLWAKAQSQAAINANLSNELESGEGLEAVFPQGGRWERVRGVFGAGSGPTARIWGILPAGLVVPSSTGANRMVPADVDGNIEVGSHYAGAEEFVVRHLDQPDRHGYAVYNEDDLYIGITDVGGSPTSKVRLFIDPDWSQDLSAQADDYRLSAALDGVIDDTIFGTGLGGWRGPANAAETSAAASYSVGYGFSGGDVTPSRVEYRIPKAMAGDLTGTIGFSAMQSVSDGDSSGGFFQHSPRRWGCLSFGEEAEPEIANLRIRAIVIRDGEPVFHPLVITDAVSGAYYGGISSTLPGSSGYYIKYVPANRSIRLSLEQCPGCTYGAPTFAPVGVQPTSAEPLSVVFDGFAPSGPDHTLAESSFFITSPPKPLTLIGFVDPETAPAAGEIVQLADPAVVTRATVMRSVPDRKVVPETTEVTLFGKNFRDTAAVETLLHNCLDLTLTDGPGCREGVDWHRCSIVPGSVQEVRDPSGAIQDAEGNKFTTMRILVPEAADYGPWNVAIKIGSVWERESGLLLTLPDYPQLHGFEFKNDPDQRAPGFDNWQNFTSVFQSNAYSPASFCAPDPMYVLYSGIFNLIDRSINGTCVGFAATSRLFATGGLDPEDFGAHYAFGIPGILEERLSNPKPPDPRELEFVLVPVQPDTYEFRGVCRGHRPTNTWGHLRRNHLVQLSHEVIQEIMDQSDGRPSRRGEPRDVYDRVAANSNYVLSMIGDGGGHAVTPIRVHEGFRQDDCSKARVADLTPITGDLGTPRYRVIEIYDNNFPGDSRYIEIDYQDNTFKYHRGGRKGTFEGRSIYSLPLSIWQSGRTRPRIIRDGQAILYQIVMGDADVEHEDADGSPWGWDAGGNFSDKYDAAESIFFLDGLESDTRNAIFMPPNGTLPARSVIHAKGGEYFFHADQGSVMMQLQADGEAGNEDAVVLSNRENTLCGMRVEPEFALTNVRAHVGVEFTPTETATFALGVSKLAEKQDLDLEIADGARAIVLTNDSEEALDYTLAVNGLEKITGASGESDFGALSVPAGATQVVRLSDWPANTSLTTETDFDRDGTPDSVVTVPAESVSPPPAWPPLEITYSNNGIEVRWDDLPGAGLATSTDLVNWSIVHQGGGPDLQQTYFLPIDQAPDQLYFQLRRQ